mgnify:CR=1 FL=1
MILEMKKKRILLFNPISGRGHFDSWAKLFAISLDGGDYEVRVLSPFTPLDIKVDFQHARINEDVNTPYDNGPIFSNVFGVTIGNRPPSLVTAIFIDGAWVCSPDGVWD